MNSFRYQAIELSGAPTEGVIQAEDRKAALQLLGKRGLYPSNLELCSANGNGSSNGNSAPAFAEARESGKSGGGFGHRIKGKQITAFTREMAALLGAAIPIPQALSGLGEEEENPALRDVILKLADSVRKGIAFSAALDEHPRLFSKLYVSMVRVGEEAGQLQKVMADLADLLEHEDEVRGEVITAVSYPVFVLCFGVATVTVLLTVVLPKLSGMLQEMMSVLPLPTLILLRTSAFFHHNWLGLLIAVSGAIGGLWWYRRTPQGAEMFDRIKLRLPLIGPVFQAAALGRFARTLGTLARSGVSLLPALKIVENTIGNRVLARQIALVAEETRGGDSLAAPLRKLNIFPRTVVQMISVGEESGRLDEMLLKVADIEERQMRARTKTLISLLAPILIMVVGALVGFMVIALLLPIFKMSSVMR
ncbi:MAG: type II secretion system F family protein [Akkermansiaceae bacterium]|nr:type II secretion system F family protein [Verrucomicrobiales bacterium]